jgi:hypothetical protein
MPELQRISSSSVVFTKLPFDIEHETFMMDSFNLVVTNMRTPVMGGLSILKCLDTDFPDNAVYMITTTSVKETCNYFMKLPSVAVGELKLKRNLAETSAILRFSGDINLLNDAYIFKQPKEIESYLWNNQFLLDILFEAYEQIIDIFGKNVELHLELHRDYEEDFEELFIVIKSSFSTAVAREMMDKLDETWFLDILDKTRGKLCITEEPL